MNNDGSTKAYKWILYAGLAGMLLVMITGNRDFFYDEHFYIDNVRLFNEHGLGITYLSLHKASAGITQTLVQWAFQPLTGLIPWRTRLVNVLLLGFTMLILGRIVKRYSGHLSGLWMLAIPMTYVCAGMTLSEMPAVFFISCALSLRLKASAIKEGSWFNYAGRFFLSAICMTLAVLGRQPYLAIVFLFPLIELPVSRSRMIRSAIWILLVLAPCIPVFYAWKGLVPPNDGALYSGMISTGAVFSFSHFLLCFFYTAACMMILSPSIFITVKRGFMFLLLLILITGSAAAYSGLGDYLPARSLMNSVFSVMPGLTFPIHMLVSGLIITGALWIIVSLCSKAWKSRNDGFTLFNTCAVLAIGITCGFITLQFNSRYAFQAAPFMLLVAAGEKSTGRFLPLRIAAGVATGLLSLYSYYFLT